MRRNLVFKRSVAVLAAAAAVALAVAGCAAPGDPNEGDNGGVENTDPFVIGVNDDLSGPISFAGLTNLAGIETYFDYVNEEKGGVHGRQIELVTLDTRADGATSIANYQELVEDHGAIAVMGNSASAAWAVTGPLSDEYEVLQIGYGNADDFFTTYHPWLFKNAMTQDQYAPLLENVVESHLFPDDSSDLRVAVYAMETASGPPFIAAVEGLAAEKGWEIVQSQTAAIGATDCTAQAAQVASAEPDVVFANITSVGEDIVCFQQLQARGYEGAWVNTHSSNAESTYEALQSPNFISSRFVSWWEDDSVPGIQDLVERAEAYGHSDQLGAYSTDGYVAAILIEAALLECGQDCTPTALRDALSSLSDVDTGGIAGPALGFTSGDLGHTFPQVRAFVWDPDAGRSTPLTDWICVPGRC